MVKQTFLTYKRYATILFTQVFFPWLLRNKQPVEIGAQVSPLNQPIGRLENRKNTYVKIYLSRNDVLGRFLEIIG